MKTRVKIVGVLDPEEVVESYGTVKNRLFRSDLFVELTNKSGKFTQLKTTIERVWAIPVMQKTKVTKKDGMVPVQQKIS